MSNFITDYRESKALNYSVIKRMNNPYGAKYYMDNPHRDEDETSFMRIGDTVDILLTDPDSYDARIAYYPDKRPTPQMLKFIDALPLGLTKDSDESLYSDAYVKLDTNTKVSTLVTKLGGEPRNFQYYEFRAQSLGKTIVSKDEMETVLAYKSSLILNPFIGRYFSEQSINWEVHTQVPIYWECNGVQCKALLDMLVIDHYSKLIKPIDVKTSSRAFSISMKTYEYYLQASHYTDAVKALKEGRASSPVIAQLPDYPIDNFQFIVASAKDKSPAYLVRMSNHDLIAADCGGTINGKPVKGRLQRIEDYKWHEATGEWQYARDYIENRGTILTNIFDNDIKRNNRISTPGPRDFDDQASP